MIGKRTLGLICAALVFLVLVGPLAAGESTYRFEIPGCYS